MPLTVAGALALATVGGGALGGQIAIGGAVVPGDPGSRAGILGAEGFAEVFLAILSLNVPVAASLAAGILSVGTITAVTGLLLGLYLGSTVGAAVNTVGAASLWSSVSSYVVVEMFGLALAAVAGFLPLAAMVCRSAAPDASALRRYISGVRMSSAMALAAVVVLLAAAAIEAAVIAGSQ